MPTNIQEIILSLAFVATAFVGVFAVTDTVLATNGHHGECVLALEKWKSKSNVVPGEFIEYKLEFQNVGDANCTGTGVHVADELDFLLTFVSETHSPNVTFGYPTFGTYNPNDHTLHWNADTLSPGELGWVIIKAKVETPSTCSATLSNTAFITSKEYDNFNTWAYSNTVTTQVTKDCTPPPPPPVQPTCALNVNFAEVDKNEAITLSWNTTNATSFSINQDIGSVTPVANGSTVYTPSVTTTFTGTATGAGGTVTCTKTVTVRTPPPPPPPPTDDKPSCPFDPKANRTIVNFTGVRFVSKPNLVGGTFNGDAVTYFKDVHVNVPAGTYTVNLAAWDGYPDRVNVTQPHEQYLVKLQNGASVLATTNATSDVADFVASASVTEVVNNTFVVPNGVNKVVAKHAYYPDTSSPNSVVPLCAAFDRIPPSYEKPTCRLNINHEEIDLNEQVTLSWDTTNATSFSLNQNIGNVIPVSSGSKAYTPSVTMTFTGTAKGPGGEATCTVKVKVREPQGPSCPLSATGDEILVSLSNTFIRSDKGESAAKKGPVSVSIPAGKYKITLASYDDHTGHGGQNQPKESWFAIFKDGNTTVAASNAISDLPENDDYRTQVVDTSLALSTAVNKVIAYHAAYSDTSSPNSVYPLCMLLKPIPEPDAPACTLEADPTEIDPGGSSTLSWTTTNAVSFSINQSIGSVTPVAAGTKNVSPSVTTTYTGTATAADGKTKICTATVTVQVHEPVPQCTVSISSSSIKTGEGVTVSWTSSNVTSGFITNIGSTTPVSSSSVQLFPADDTTYNATFTGPYGTVTCNANVVVTSGPGGCQGNSCGGGLNPPNVVMYKKATEQPLVASVFLSQIPYTGFEAGTALIIIFWFAIGLFAAVIAFYIVERKNAGFASRYLAAFVGISANGTRMSHTNFGHSTLPLPHVSVQEEQYIERAPVIMPQPLPIVSASQAVAAPHMVNENSIPPLEDVIEARAHAAGVLMSPESVALATNLSADRASGLKIFDEILNEAVRTIPREDGWIMLTSDRLNTISMKQESNVQAEIPAPVAVASAYAPFAPVTDSATAHVTVGRIDEASATAFVGAIVSGDRDTAFGIVRSMEHAAVNPSTLMTSTATVLDRLYRVRHGGKNGVEQELVGKAANVRDDNLHALVEVFTHSLDTVYSNPFTGVKLALAQAFDVVG